MKRPEGTSHLGPFHFCSRCAFALEVKLQAELNDAHSTVGGNLAERGAAARIVWIQELNMVKGIEEFGAELERCGFGNMSALCER